MSKPILVVVHGIGEHTPESIVNTVNVAATNALKRYDFWGEQEFKDYVTIVGVGYNDIFKEALRKIKEQHESISSYFKGIGFADSLIGALGDVEDGKFLHTHVFDVLFYAGIHSGLVRAVVAEKISEALADDNAGEVHILGHSMGTAVVHDVLCNKYPADLDPYLNKIESLWMVANTSRLIHDWNPVQNNIDPKTSIVNPSTSALGCVKKYFNVNHKLDFVSQPHPFKAPSTWEHYEESTLQVSYYRDIETYDFNVNKNPHDLRQYLEDPKVSEPFLSAIMPTLAFGATAIEHEEANAKGKGGVALSQDVVDFAQNNINNVNDLKQFAVMLIELKDKFDDIWEDNHEDE